MEYITVQEASILWGITERRITTLCIGNRIPDAKKFGSNWAIPKSSTKPEDARKKENIQIPLILNQSVQINRVWSMPNKNTFDIKPIKQLIMDEMTDGIWIDPFANKNRLATVTNDLNPEYNTDYHIDALDFLRMFDDDSIDGVLYDPPYSPRQVSESYNHVGYNVTWDTTKASFWAKHKKEISRIVRLGGKVISFGWNSGGIGNTYGFEIQRILMVPHGGWHNDTICTVELKTKEGKFENMGVVEKPTCNGQRNEQNIIDDSDIKLIGQLEQLPVDFWDFKSDDTRELTHGIHTYPAMMIYPISRNLIRLVKQIMPVRTLLDPFAGSGTVLVEGMLAGIECIYGNDINPLAILLSRVKTRPIGSSILMSATNELKSALDKLYDRFALYIANINDNIEKTYNIDYSSKTEWGDSAPHYLKLYCESINLTDITFPEFNNIGYWFKPRVIFELQLIKSAISTISEQEIRDFMLIAFSESIRLVSNRRNGEFKMFRMPIEKVKAFNPDVRREFMKILSRNNEKMAQFDEIIQSSEKTASVMVYSDNAMDLNSITDGSIDLIITSPPYGDSRTTVAYGEFSRLSLQWIDLNHIGSKEIMSIDKNLMGGTKYRNGFEYDLPSDTLKAALESIIQSDVERAGDVFSFYKDLFRSMEAVSKKSKAGGYQFWVVGNRTVKGMLLLTDKIITEFGSSLGLIHLKTIGRNISNKVMPSLNSPTNETGKQASTMTNEHIVLLKKKEKGD